MASPFLDRVRNVIRGKYYSIRTEKTYLHWIVAYIRFHGKAHPEQLGEADIRRYLTHLAVDCHVSPNTQKTALNALVFLYRQVRHSFATHLLRNGADIRTVQYTVGSVAFGVTLPSFG